jgi:uncharacterized membrane protein
VPHGTDFTVLKPLLPIFLSYILSFIYLAIYWNNHHHMLHTVGRVSGGILWSNLSLLFALSLIPFATGWMGENHFAAEPSALYGMVLLMAAVAYFVLQSQIIKFEGSDSTLARAVRRDWKGKLSIALYVVAIPCAFIAPWIAQGLYIIVAAIWFVPDKRIEREVTQA